MNEDFLSIDWGGSELKGINTGNGRHFSLSAGNIRLLDQTRLQTICSEIVRSAEAAENEINWLIGAAGADDLAATKRLAAAIKTTHPRAAKVIIKADYECNHAACLDGKDGILSVNGTGSVVFARCGQQSVRLGGWGYIIDELPSGAWFGRMALAAVLSDLEGTSTGKFCREAYERRFGKADRRVIIDELYQANSIQRKLGEYAPVFSDALVAGCPFAAKAAGDSIARLLDVFQQAASRSGMTGAINLCGSGGLWAQWSEFAQLVSAAANRWNLTLQLIKPAKPLLLGPLILEVSTNPAAEVALQKISDKS